MSLDRWGLCPESVETGELCGLEINHKGPHEVRLSRTEQRLAAATAGWTLPTVVRTYQRDKDGQTILNAEVAVLAAHGYQPSMQSEDGGHIHAGRLLLTGGLSVFAGGSGVRSKGNLTLTFQRLPATPSPAATVAATDPISALETLASMRDRGLITSEEYEAKRAQVLERL